MIRRSTAPRKLSEKTAGHPSWTLLAVGVALSATFACGDQAHSSIDAAAHEGAASGQGGTEASSGASANGNAETGSGNGSVDDSNCQHEVCELGGALDPSCSPCVHDICETTPYCCDLSAGDDSAWDQNCVDQVATACGLSCPDTSSSGAGGAGGGTATTSGGGATCPPGTTACGSDCVDTVIDIDHCGACSNACPGQGTPHTTTSCSNSTCHFTCGGEYYDTDDDPSNGCETHDLPHTSHREILASSLGSLGGGQLWKTARIPSDRRAHDGSLSLNLSSYTGAAPDWHKLKVLGSSCSPLCSATLEVTVKITGSSNCYRTRIKNGTFGQSYFNQQCSKNNCTFTVPPNSLANFDDVLISVEKTCSASSQIENAQYSIQARFK